jgi:hypothetical protein
MSMTMVAQVRDFSKSRGDARFLLTMIASYVNPHTGWAWPSLATLAHVTTKGKPYLLKLIHALEALGELEVRRGRGRGHPNHYRITIGYEPARDAPEKGHRSENLSLEEKVILNTEKVIHGWRKGNPSGYSKGVLHTLKEILESGGRGEKVTEDKDPADQGEWIMKNRYYGTHRVCGADHQPGTPCPTYGIPEGGT